VEALRHPQCEERQLVLVAEIEALSEQMGVQCPDLKVPSGWVPKPSKKPGDIDPSKRWSTSGRPLIDPRRMDVAWLLDALKHYETCRERGLSPDTDTLSVVTTTQQHVQQQSAHARNSTCGGASRAGGAGSGAGSTGCAIAEEGESAVEDALAEAALEESGLASVRQLQRARARAQTRSNSGRKPAFQQSDSDDDSDGDDSGEDLTAAASRPLPARPQRERKRPAAMNLCATGMMANPHSYSE
jgi:hypothetical protein